MTGEKERESDKKRQETSILRGRLQVRNKKGKGRGDPRGR
jgi:hypothetical protein